MLVDHARIHVIAGKGGDGCISFRREKYVPKGGPDGGDGGRGGSVVLVVDPSVRTLLDCRERPRYRAPNGGAGSGNNRTGRDGGDLVIEVPPGTMIKDVATGDSVADLVEPGTRWQAARGGRGGRGNARFATPARQAPRHAEPGEPGEERWLELELKLIADVGLVGPPNAGKSTLLSRVSRARPRIAPYAFTTLEPNLGIADLDGERRFVVADLPGLIEGAHRGRGLGLEFLRHVERTRVLAFLIEATSPNAAEDLMTIEHELREYRGALMDKPRIVVLTKADLLAPGEAETVAARAGLPDAHVVSAHTGHGIDRLLQTCWRMVAQEAKLEAAGE
ncbi:MAG TPA: GTPase ObgE [Candidatus Eisenbacteria bacterium]|nr:GTPase ObgE [Candidatus Eisenbacteria bacterium]